MVLATVVIKNQIWLIAKPVGAKLEIKVKQLEKIEWQNANVEQKLRTD